jgi:hypothetical protein
MTNRWTSDHKLVFSVVDQEWRYSDEAVMVGAFTGVSIVIAAVWIAMLLPSPSLDQSSLRAAGPHAGGHALFHVTPPKVQHGPDPTPRPVLEQTTSSITSFVVRSMRFGVDGAEGTAIVMSMA